MGAIHWELLATDCWTGTDFLDTPSHEHCPCSIPSHELPGVLHTLLGSCVGSAGCCVTCSEHDCVVKHVSLALRVEASDLYPPLFQGAFVAHGSVDNNIHVYDVCDNDV